MIPLFSQKNCDTERKWLRRFIPCKSSNFRSFTIVIFVSGGQQANSPDSPFRASNRFSSATFNLVQIRRWNSICDWETLSDQNVRRNELAWPDALEGSRRFPSKRPCATDWCDRGLVTGSANEIFRISSKYNQWFWWSKRPESHSGCNKNHWLWLTFNLRKIDWCQISKQSYW